MYATSVYVLSVAAHHPAGSRAVVPTPPSPALPAARTPSPTLATRRSITSLTHTRGASPAPQFDAQSAPPTIPRAPPKPSRERVLSHVGFESFPTTRSRSQQDPSRPAAHVSASLHGPPAQQSLSITARTTARRRQRRQVLHAQQDSAPNFQPTSNHPLWPPTILAVTCSMARDATFSSLPNWLLTLMRAGATITHTQSSHAHNIPHAETPAPTRSCTRSRTAKHSRSEHSPEVHVYISTVQLPSTAVFSFSTSIGYNCSYRYLAIFQGHRPFAGAVDVGYRTRLDERSCAYATSWRIFYVVD